MLFKKNVSLKRYTSFKIGGKTKYFFESKNQRDLIKAVETAKQRRTPIFILGGGTKLLVGDSGFDGLAIKIKSSKFKVRKNSIIAEAGMPLNRLVPASVKAGLAGLEWATQIPGTIGGAIHGNSGAFGFSISNIVKNVTVLDPDSLKTETYSNRQCQFCYRRSIFKNSQGIILSAELRLEKGESETSLAIIKKYQARRKERIPVFPSAGSIFKNFQIANLPEFRHKFHKYLNQKLMKIHGNSVPVRDGKISAAYLIEKCGLKGKRIGGAKISEKHANFIVNTAGASAKDVFCLINFAKEAVQNKFGVRLEEEIEYLNAENISRV